MVLPIVFLWKLPIKLSRSPPSKNALGKPVHQKVAPQPTDSGRTETKGDESQGTWAPELGSCLGFGTWESPAISRVILAWWNIIDTSWWFQAFFIFTPKLGEDSQFDWYFSKGLKSPTRIDYVSFGQMDVTPLPESIETHPAWNRFHSFVQERSLIIGWVPSPKLRVHTWNRRGPKRKFHLLTINFQVQVVISQEGIFQEFSNRTYWTAP